MKLKIYNNNQITKQKANKHRFKTNHRHTTVLNHMRLNTLLKAIRILFIFKVRRLIMKYRHLKSIKLSVKWLVICLMNTQLNLRRMLLHIMVLRKNNTNIMMKRMMKMINGKRLHLINNKMMTMNTWLGCKSCSNKRCIKILIKDSQNK